ncbi:hypothetical protein N7490_009953 [Penicillium lividum]|nr:hypothetical protein N7490_009953 [Penicillium lividum]
MELHMHLVANALYLTEQVMLHTIITNQLTNPPAVNMITRLEFDMSQPISSIPDFCLLEYNTLTYIDGWPVVMP